MGGHSKSVHFILDEAEKIKSEKKLIFVRLKSSFYRVARPCGGYEAQKLFTRKGVPVSPNWWDKTWRKINEKRR